MKKKVSAVVPCYNAAKYLDKCITQLLHQTIGIENIEIILVDDASTDGGETRALIEAYEKKFPNTIIAVFLEQNLRQGGARNAGVTCANGEYLIFCDADDWLLEETMEHTWQAAKEYDADVVAFSRRNVNMRDNSVGLEKGTENKFFELEEERKRKSFLLDMRETGYSSQNKLFRTSLIKEYQITFVEHLIMEESSFSLPVRLYAKKYYYLDECLYICWLSPESTLRNRNWESRKWDNLQVWVIMIEELKCRGMFQKYQEEIEYLFFTDGVEGCLSAMFLKGCSLTKNEWIFFVDIVKRILPVIRKNPYIEKTAHPFNRAWNDLIFRVLDMEFTDKNVKSVNQALSECVRAFSRCPALC